MADTAAGCTTCGEALDPTSAYCAHCGTKTSTPPSTPYPPVPASATGQNALLLTQGSFFSSLFDLSFTSLVATRIIKVLYVLSIVLIGLTALLFIVGAFHRSAAAGVAVLFIVAPIMSLFYLVYARVILELFIALFRIMENTSELVAQGRRDS